MATKRKFPNSDVPMTDDAGRPAREWYQLLLNENHVGTPATAAAAGTATALPAQPKGYLTVMVNGEPMLTPYYAVP